MVPGVKAGCLPGASFATKTPHVQFQLCMEPLCPPAPGDRVPILLQVSKCPSCSVFPAPACLSCNQCVLSAFKGSPENLGLTWRPRILSLFEGLPHLDLKP